MLWTRSAPYKIGHFGGKLHGKLDNAREFAFVILALKIHFAHTNVKTTVKETHTGELALPLLRCLVPSFISSGTHIPVDWPRDNEQPVPETALPSAFTRRRRLGAAI